MASFSEQNYLSVNTMSDAAEKDWSLTGIFKKSVQQATVQLESGKEYQYACRWPFKEGDVAIIGNTLLQNYTVIEQSPNSGQFGLITYAEPKMTIKKSHAVELDYVFTESVSKKNITDCIKYLESPLKFETLQYGKMSENYFPLSFYIRRLLAAASIIAHPKFAAAEDGESWPNGPEYTLLFRSLLENPGFRTAFVNRMAVLLNMNFSSARVLARIESMMSEIESEIPRDQERWNLSASRMDRQLEDIKSFAKDRPEVVYDELREYFELGRPIALSLSVSGPGIIKVHGLKIDSYPLTVNFFEGLPVTLEAMPTDGGIWAGWSDGVMETVRSVNPGEIKSLTAVFK